MLYRHRFHIFCKVFLDVLRCCRSVMACCAQMDFYEASQLHLFHFASIKLAEATVLCATSGRREVFPPHDLRSHKDTGPPSYWRRSKIVHFCCTNGQYREDKHQKWVGKWEKKKTCVTYADAHSLTLQVSDCGWYICAWCVS